MAAAQPEPQAYGKLLGSMTARIGLDHPAAIKAAEEANSLLDTWIGHFELARAYLAARQYPQADSDCDRCYSRQGVVGMFLADTGVTSWLLLNGESHVVPVRGMHVSAQFATVVASLA